MARPQGRPGRDQGIGKHSMSENHQTVSKSPNSQTHPCSPRSLPPF